MSIGINSNYSSYGSYAGIYANSPSSQKQPAAESTTAAAETGSTAQKTAADELSYLSSKYSNYSFVAANFTQGMQYGSSSTTNVAISPQFLAKMASDPDLEKEYEGYIADMQQLDAQFAKSVEAGGWHVVAKGWAIDKDGGISSWCITQKDDTKSYLQKLSENADKIQERTEEKKQAQKETEEKREAAKEEQAALKEKLEKAGKDQFGGRFKNAVVTGKDDETAAGFPHTDNAAAAGRKLDIKA